VNCDAIFGGTRCLNEALHRLVVRFTA
jgi:hypothetical protein